MTDIADQPVRGGSGLDTEAMVLHDAGAAEHELARYFPALRLASGEDFRTDLRVVVGSEFSLAEYSFATAGSAHAGADDFVVVESVGRRYRVECDGREIDLAQPYLAPADRLVATWEEVQANVISLRRDAVERMARSASGDPELRLHRSGSGPVSAEAARYWQATARGIRNTVAAAPDAFSSPLIERAACHRLVAALLTAFPVGWRDRPVQRAGRSTVDRALEFMRQHAGEPITVHDVAGAVFISSRGLHAAFVRELGTTPSEALRTIRLEAARSDLLAAAPGVTASAIARRWGFGHLSRFAAEYQRTYGELPSATLRR